jgi:NlpC/P60 family
MGSDAERADSNLERFGSSLERTASSLERVESSLQEFRLFSSGLTPRVGRLHIGVLAAAFFVAALWITLLANGLPGRSRTAAQQSPQGRAPQGQTQEPPPSPEQTPQQVSQQPGQNQPAPYKAVPRYRLLTLKEERTIVKAVWAHTAYATDVNDCSHTVHQIYAAAGYEYPYASSFDLYRGTANFVRVMHPQSGDLIAWPGHVGIVLSAKKHSFYSLVNTGLEAQDYRGRYWRGRGQPRFYRYIVERNIVQRDIVGRKGPSQRPGQDLPPAKTQQR